MQFGVLAVSIVPSTVFAQTQAPSRCEKFVRMFTIDPKNLTDSAKNEPGITEPLTAIVPRYCTAFGLFNFVLNLLFMFAGAAAVLFIIVGGFQYMTSAGNDEQAEGGKKTLTNAVIGLVVIILAATIVRLVVNTISGVPSEVPAGTTQTQGGGNAVNGSNATTSGANYGNKPGGGTEGLAEYLTSGKAVSLSPSTVTSNTAVVSLSLVIPANMKESFDTEFCKSQTKTFTVKLESSGITDTTMLSNGPSGYYATVEFPGQYIKAAETAVIFICGAPYPSVSIPFANEFTPVSGGDTALAEEEYYICMNEQGDPNACCQGKESLSVCGGSSTPTGKPKYSAGDIANAASNSRFAVYKEAGSFVVTITASDTNVNVMCGNYPESQRAIHFIIGGADNPEYTLSVRQLQVQLEGRPMPTVGVRICGSTIYER